MKSIISSGLKLMLEILIVQNIQMMGTHSSNGNVQDTDILDKALQYILPLLCIWRHTLPSLYNYQQT